MSRTYHISQKEQLLEEYQDGFLSGNEPFETQEQIIQSLVVKRRERAASRRLHVRFVE